MTNERTRRQKAAEFHHRAANATHAMALSASSQEERERNAMLHTFHKRQAKLWDKYLSLWDKAELKRKEIVG